MQKKNLLPSARGEMESFIREFNPGQELNEVLYKNLSELDTKSKAGDNSGHAEKVTEYFRTTPGSGGLLQLEKMWREHFLETMKPKFLPDHWSVEHNATRLKLRADAGKVDQTVLAEAGLSI